MLIINFLFGVFKVGEVVLNSNESIDFGDESVYARASKGIVERMPLLCVR